MDASDGVGVAWHDDAHDGHREQDAAAGPPTLVLITGDEMLLVDRAVWRATAAARRVEPGVERRDAVAAGLAAGEFWDLVAPSLFAEPRLVVIRGAQESAKDLAAALIGVLRGPGRGRDAAGPPRRRRPEQGAGRRA